MVKKKDTKKITKQLLEGFSSMMSIYGKQGGLKGGAARAKNLSKERRKEIATLAAKKRWSKKNK